MSEVNSVEAQIQSEFLQSSSSGDETGSTSPGNPLPNDKNNEHKDNNNDNTKDNNPVGLQSTQNNNNTNNNDNNNTENIENDNDESDVQLLNEVSNKGIP